MFIKENTTENCKEIDNSSMSNHNDIQESLNNVKISASSIYVKYKSARSKTTDLRQILKDRTKIQLNLINENNQKCDELRITNYKCRELENDRILFEELLSLRMLGLDSEEKKVLGIAEKIDTEISRYLSNLDIKLTIKQKEVLLNQIINYEIIIDDVAITLKYDIIDNSVEVLDMAPKPPNFDQMRYVLAESGDINGLLCVVREWAKSKP